MNEGNPMTPPDKEDKPIRPVKVNKDGWSRWQLPIMKGYLMGCCDCGLVHEMEFEALRPQGGKTKNGWQSFSAVKGGRVRMRARRREKTE